MRDACTAHAIAASAHQREMPVWWSGAQSARDRRSEIVSSVIAKESRMCCPNRESCGFMRSLLQVYVGGHQEDDSAVYVLDRVIVAKLGRVEVDDLAGGD